MKAHYKLFFPSFILMFSLLSACKEEKEPDCTVVACTEEFKTIYVTIEDAHGAPVILEEYYTIINSRNRFTSGAEATYEPGEYPVVSDAEMDELSLNGTMLIFVGVKGDQNIVEHQMLIGKDCCHIELISGELEIVLD